MSSATQALSADRASRSSTKKAGAARAAAAQLDYNPGYVAAAIAGTLVFLLYVLTLSPSTAMWDTSEYIAAAYTMGLPHPPGNPFFVLIGRVFSLLPIAPTVALRINVLAALCSAVAAAMWFLVTERVLVSWFPERWQRTIGGAVAVIIGATAFTVWNQSVVNEKVYTVSLAGLAIVSWLTVRWCDDPDGWKADRILVLIAYLTGLGYANHMAGFLAAPAVAVAVLIRRPRTVLRWKLLLACGAALFLGLTPFATQPIRAAHFPPINEGETTACRTKIAADCTFSEGTKNAFMYNFNRGQYGKPELSERQAPFSAQMGMWWLYFKWQWLRDPHVERPRLQAMLAAVFLVLGLFGGYVHWRRDRRSFMYFGPLVFTLTLVLIYYLNFKYGYSQSPELSDVNREVRDRDYFFLWSFSAWSVWAALGLVFVWEAVAAMIGADDVRYGAETVEAPRRQSWFVASPVLALALIPLFGNWHAASRAGHTDTADFAKDLLNSVEPYGILVTVGDNDTFPLWYAQEVEGVRKDVTIANTSLLNTDWYVRQIIRRPIFEYDAAKGPAIYRNQQWPKPTAPAIRMSFDEADRVPLIVDLTSPQMFQKGNIIARIDASAQQPRQLQRADIFVLKMIQDNDQRPMYFSRTSGGYGQELGLAPYLLTQGLARKLLPNIPNGASKDTVLYPGEGWVDLARTKALWDSFTAPRALIKRGDWVDQPSIGIPYLYLSTGALLGDILHQTGRSAEAEKVLTTVEQVAKATRLDQQLQLRRPSAPGPADTPKTIPLTPSPK